jgi:GNAT superfamily N-acetyltransferase
MTGEKYNKINSNGLKNKKEIKVMKRNNNKEINLHDLEFYELKEQMLKNLNFDCGDEDLNEFILNDSMKNIKSRLSVVYLCKYKGEIVGYVAVSNDSIKIRKEDKKRIGKKIGTKYSHYPAIKIGRLGIDKKYQNKKVGTTIIDWTIGLGIKIGSEVGTRYLSVDAYIKSQTFYEKNEFKSLQKKNKNKHTMPMYLDLENKNYSDTL